jgi:uncharacterized membrane protein
VRLSALGLNQWFLRQVGETLEPGRAALFLVVSDVADPQQAIDGLVHWVPGCCTTLHPEAEQRLLAALTDTARNADASTQPPAPGTQ